MKPIRPVSAAIALALLSPGASAAGPYSLSTGDPDNAHDAPVPGFVGWLGDGVVPVFEEPDNYLNPLFFGWADEVIAYQPAPGVTPNYAVSANALGPVTGDAHDVVSLGDLNATQITSGLTPGTITLRFQQPVRDYPGADLTVFENALISAGEAGVEGETFADLARVEVSSDGAHFARFPSLSLTGTTVSFLGTIDPTDVFNLAGKHANAEGVSWGTPFDLAHLASDPLVISGTVDLDAIRYVRLIDVPGNGAFFDSTGAPIYDPWLTSQTGGADIEAIGVIGRATTFAQWASLLGIAGADDLGDADNDGLCNLAEYAAATHPLRADHANPVSGGLRAGALELVFRRDLRASDLRFDVQVSGDLKTWETVAFAQGDADFAAAPGYAPTIADESAGPIASVQVIRKITLRLPLVPGVSRQFIRLVIVRTP